MATLPISSSLRSRCTPQFCYLRNSSTLLILVVLRLSQRFVGTHRHNYPSDPFPLTVTIPVFGLVQRLDFASISIVRRVAALTPRLTLSCLVGKALRVLGVDSSHVNIEQPTGVTGQNDG